MYRNNKDLDLFNLVQNQRIEDHLASLQYARMIQKALLPEPEMMKGLFKDYFVLFLPRDIVSGDFYYVFSRNNYICVAAGDCTGHGVPGALLSILGISFLNDILQQRSDLKANRILNLMREKVMKALRQTGEETETKDSIDIGLCIIDMTNNSLQFSGANRPLIRMRDGLLSEFKPDKMTIGVAPIRELPFNNQILDIMPGDTYYLYSDGFSDQFGEVSDKKFKQKQLKKLIESMSGLSMPRQKSFLKETFYQWKGNCQQIDDVLIFGFQI